MQPKAQLKAPTLEDPTSKVPYVSLHFLLSRGFGSYFFPFGGVGGVLVTSWDDCDDFAEKRRVVSFFVFFTHSFASWGPWAPGMISGVRRLRFISFVFLF